LKRLAIITTHPIQYNAPLFRVLNLRKVISIKVFYTWGSNVLKDKFDPGFGRDIKWDIPLLDGYDYTFLENTSGSPGSHHFFGIINPSLIKQVNEYNPECILVYGWSFYSHLKLLQFFKHKRRIIFRGDSHLLDDNKHFSIKKFFKSSFLKWIYKHIDMGLYTGSENKKYFQKFGLKEQQLIFAPHSIDNDRFRHSSKINLRKKLNIPDEDIVFLFAGKFEEKKNPLFLLDAFIIANIANSHIIFTGNGNLQFKLQKIIENLDTNFKDRIHLMDFQNQSKMPEVYSTCDVFVLPSQGPGETWGLSVNEAMACSKAILVSSKCGCATDLVKPGRNGYVFESNNKLDLVKKLNLLSISKVELKSFGTSSAEIIKDWSYETIAKVIEDSVTGFTSEK
jgi:glycosyltransferase involved in cell wall biosynthesis